MTTARMLHPDSAAEYVGGPKILMALVADKWVQPVVKRNRLTIYDVRDLDKACDKLKLELPSLLRADD